jgi:hypothetical protein
MRILSPLNHFIFLSFQSWTWKLFHSPLSVQMQMQMLHRQNQGAHKSFRLSRERLYTNGWTRWSHVRRKHRRVMEIQRLLVVVVQWETLFPWKSENIVEQYHCKPSMPLVRSVLSRLKSLYEKSGRDYYLSPFPLDPQQHPIRHLPAC